MYWLLISRLLEEEDEEEEGLLEGRGSSGSASWRWAETQPLSEPVEPERQREDEPELSVAEGGRDRQSAVRQEVRGVRPADRRV